MLEAEKWRRAKEIFYLALDLPPAGRQAFIESSAAEDAEVQNEVATLLAAHDEADGFIGRPQIAVADFVGQSSDDPLIGGLIGAYRIESEIGRGGMGAVYLGSRADRAFDKKVAVKLIKRGFDTDAMIRRFRTERQILAGLEHPSITRLLDGGATENGLPYLVMDYVEGEPLTAYCARRQYSIEQILYLFLDVCAAVAHAHQNLVIHRDLKPSNILVTTARVPKLLDFGVAKLIAADPEDNATLGTVCGAMTPEYASPEQATGQPITTATDVYSLGVILYELLSGARPFSLKSKSADEISKILTADEPLRPSAVLDANPRGAAHSSKSLKGDLDNIVLMAMRKEPERRYTSVEQFASDIRRYLNGLPVIAREDRFSYRAGKFVRRHKFGVGAAGAVAVSLVAGILTISRQERIARQERDKARNVSDFLKKMLGSADPRAVGKDAKIVEVLRIAADSIEEDFSRSPEIAADLRSTIGLTFLSLGQIESAEPHLTEALRVCRELFGTLNAQTAAGIYNLGKLRQAEGDWAAAKELFYQSLEVFRALSADHTADTVAVMGNLGYVLMLEGNYEESKNIHYEKLRVVKRLYGERRAEFAQTLTSLADVYAVTGDERTAEALQRQALELIRRRRGDDHPDTAKVMLSLAITIMAEQDAESEVLIRQTLASHQRFFGAEHTETAWAIFYLGDLYLRRGDHRRAAECGSQILNWRGLSIPETHPLISITLLMLGRSELLADRPAAAEPFLRECIALRRETLASGHWMIATAENFLGECIAKQNRFDEALPLLRESCRTLRDKLGAEHPHTVAAEKRLADSLDSASL